MNQATEYEDVDISWPGVGGRNYAMHTMPTARVSTLMCLTTSRYDEHVLPYTLAADNLHQLDGLAILSFSCGRPSIDAPLWAKFEFYSSPIYHTQGTIVQVGWHKTTALLRLDANRSYVILPIVALRAGSPCPIMNEGVAPHATVNIRRDRRDYAPTCVISFLRCQYEHGESHRDGEG